MQLLDGISGTDTEMWVSMAATAVERRGIAFIGCSLQVFKWWCSLGFIRVHIAVLQVVAGSERYDESCHAVNTHRKGIVVQNVDCGAGHISNQTIEGVAQVNLLQCFVVPVLVVCKERT